MKRINGTECTISRMAPPWNRIFGKPKRVTTLVPTKWEFTLRGHYWPISNVNFVVFSAPESPRRKRWNSIGQFKILNSWVGADAESWLDWFEVLCRAWTLRQLSDWFDLKLSPELGRTGRRLIGWFARFCSSLGRACVSLILIDLQSVFFFPNAHTVKERYLLAWLSLLRLVLVTWHYMGVKSFVLITACFSAHLIVYFTYYLWRNLSMTTKTSVR